MTEIDWRQTTIQILAKRMGPAAELYVDSAAEKVKLVEMVPTLYLKFTRELCASLPPEVDAKAIQRELQDAIFKRYGGA